MLVYRNIITRLLSSQQKLTSIPKLVAKRVPLPSRPYCTSSASTQPEVNDSGWKDIASCNTALNAVKNGEHSFSVASKVLNTIRDSKLRPNDETFTLLLACCGKEANIDIAKDILDMQKKFTSSPQPFIPFLENAANNNHILTCIDMLAYMDTKQIPRTREVYEAVLPGVGKFGTLAEAKLIQERMVTDKSLSTPQMLVHLLHAYCKNSGLGYAWDIFKFIKGQTVLSVETYTELLKCIIKSNDVSKVSPLIEKMRLDKVQADKTFYADVVAFLIRKGDDKKAYDLLEYWTKKDQMQLDTSLLKELVILRANKGDVKQARKLYQQMVQDKQQIPESVIIAILNASGILGQAVEFLHVLRGDGIKVPPQALEVVLDHIRVTQDYNQAVHFLEFMSKEAEWMDAKLANKVLQIFVAKKQPEKVQALVTSMHTKNLKMDTEIYNTLITFFVQEDKLDTAIETLQKMIETNVKVNSDSFRPLIGKLVRHQQKEKALSVLDMVGNAGGNVQNIRKHVLTLLQ